MNPESIRMADTLNRARRRFAGMPGSLRSQLFHGAAGSGIIAIFLRLLLLATAIILARTLGPDGYGVYTYVTTTIMLLSVPVRFGVPQLLVREISAYRQHNQWQGIQGLLRRGKQANTLFSMVLLGVGLLVGLLLSDKIDALDWLTLVCALPLIPLGAIVVIQTSALRGLHCVVRSQLPEGVVRPLAFLVMIASWLALFGSMRPDQVMILAVVAAMLGVFSATLLLWLKLPGEIKDATPHYETKKWLLTALPFSLIGGLQLINTHADIVMLGLLSNSSDVGIYRIVSLGSALVALPLIAADTALAPKIASLYAIRDRVRLQRMMTASARYMLIFAIPIAVILILFGGAVLTQLFGEQFSSGAVALAILSLAQLFNVAIGAVGQFLIMTGHEAITVKIIGVVAVCNILMNYVLIPIYGLNGAALASALTVVSSNIWLAITMRRKLHLKAGSIIFN